MVYLSCVTALFLERGLHEPAFMRHFTYWSLLLSWVWTVGWLAAIAAKPRAVPESGSEAEADSDDESESNTLRPHAEHLPVFRAEAVYLALTAFPVLGILTTVAVLITALPLFDNGMIEAQVEDVPLSVANVANLLIHYLPLALMALLVVGTWPSTAEAVGTSVAALTTVIGHKGATFMRVAVAVVVAGGVPGAFAAMYAALFDFTVEYDANVSPGPVFAVGLVALVLLVGVHIIASGKAAACSNFAPQPPQVSSSQPPSEPPRSWANAVQ
jgi:hypothetical protein